MSQLAVPPMLHSNQSQLAVPPMLHSNLSQLAVPPMLHSNLSQLAVPPMLHSNLSQLPPQCGSWPRVFILGVQKAATTSLEDAFTHSDGVGVSGQGRCCESGYCVKPPFWGESHYLIKCTIDGKRACSNYPLIFASDRINVDSTPEYLSCPPVPGDLHAVMPASMRGNVRFIMIFREQSSRVFSIYNHRRVLVATSDRPESHPAWFAAFCDWEATITDGKFEPTFHNFALCLTRRVRINRSIRDWYSQDKCNWNEADITRGLYHQALETWRAVWPREQILVIPFHQLVSDEMGGVMDRIAAFTGVPSLPRTLPAKNTQVDSWKVDAMCCATRSALLQFHEAENLKLYRQLADDQSARLAPSQEMPFSPFPPPRCVECPDASSDYCEPGAPRSLGGMHFDALVVDHPNAAVLCVVLVFVQLLLLVLYGARHALRKEGGGYTNPMRHFLEMDSETFWSASEAAPGRACISISRLFAGRRATSGLEYASLLLGSIRRLGRRAPSYFGWTFLNGDPTSSVAAVEGGVEGGDEGGGEGGALSHGKNPAWVMTGAPESCRLTLGAWESCPPPSGQEMLGGGEKKSKKQKKPKEKEAASKPSRLGAALEFD